MAKPMKTLELQYPMISDKLLIKLHYTMKAASTINCFSVYFLSLSLYIYVYHYAVSNKFGNYHDE